MNLIRAGHAPDVDHLKKLGLCIATICPRINDCVPAIRSTSLEIIQMLCYVDQLLRNPEDVKPSDNLKTLTSIKQLLVAEPVPENRISQAGEVAECLSTLVPSSEFKPLVVGLIPGVNDCDEQSSFGTCTVLRVLVEERGNEVEEYLPKIIDKYLLEMIKLPDSSSRLELYLKIVVVLAKVHFEEVVEILLQKPLPLSREIILCLQSIALDESLSERLLDKL